MIRKCKCGMPIYDRFKECTLCFVKRLKTPMEKNIALGGRFYEEKKNVERG